MRLSIKGYVEIQFPNPGLAINYFLRGTLVEWYPFGDDWVTVPITLDPFSVFLGHVTIYILLLFEVVLSI